MAGRDAGPEQVLPPRSVAQTTPSAPIPALDVVALDQALDASEPVLAGRAETVAQHAETTLRAPALDVPTPVVNLEDTFERLRLDLTAELPVVSAEAPAGRRRAVRHAGTRGPLFKGLPSAPVLVGLAALAVAVGGAVSSQSPELAGASERAAQVGSVSAAQGTSGAARIEASATRGSVSRATDRQALQQANEGRLREAAEAKAEVRSTALGELAARAEEQSKKLLSDRWVLPLTPSITTATYGQVGLWATYHTGLDFNGNDGDPISAVARGTVTFVGYAGAYGNKTIVTLEDGTEIWYAHQSAQYVSVGDQVASGEVIGAVGSTGNVTGSHLHLEVRPGGGDPVDPFAAFQVHGITP